MKPSLKGFTIIESIIYLALFSIVIGGALAASSLLFEGAGRGTASARLLGEGTFMLQKIALQETVLNQVFLQGLTDSSITVSNFSTSTASSTNLGATIYSTGVQFTLTARTRQGRSISRCFFATTTL